jgi:hypothetical protein
MKKITLTTISISALYGSYMFGGYTLVILMFILLCLHTTLSYNNIGRDEDFHVNEDHIPVIGGKRISWEEYREIPNDIDMNGRVKFNRNNL